MSGYSENRRPGFVPALILFPPAIPFFYKYRVRLSQGSLTFGYSFGCTRVTVPVAEIGSVEASNSASCCAWGGYGIRTNFAGEVGYIAGGGPNLKITHNQPDGGKKTYVFSCSGAAELKQMLLSASSGGAVVADADGL